MREKELVYFEKYAGFRAAVCDSQTVADKFNKRHDNVLRDITTLRERLDELVAAKEIDNKDDLLFVDKVRHYRGQEFPFVEMNRPAFSLLVMRFTGEAALKWQVIFNRLFYAMEERLLLADNNHKDEQWLTQREQGKIARHEATDAVKEFLDYVQVQNPQSHYLKDGIAYARITKMSYKCLGFIQYGKKDIRALLDKLELAHLVSAELTVASSLRKYMTQGEPYKDVIRYTERDLLALVELIGTKRRVLPANEVRIVQPKQLEAKNG